MELEYFQKGSRENPDSANNYTQYLFRVNYIELPVFYQYIVNKRFKLELGPSLGFLVGYFLHQKTKKQIKIAPKKAIFLLFRRDFNIFLIIFSISVTNRLIK